MNLKFEFFARFVAVAALVFVLLGFNWDRVELESRAFVVTLGIDAGKDTPFEVSMNIADTIAMESGEDEQVTLRKAEGDSLAHALGQVEANISDKVYFGHTKAIIFGEGVLADENLLRETADTLFRNNEINIKAIVMAADGNTADILAAKPREQGLLGVYLSSFYNNNNANTASSAVKLDLEDMMAGLMNSGSTIIPRITTENDDEIAISGVAVVRDFALLDFVEEEDMAGYLWLLENAAGTQVPIEADGGHITFSTAKSRARLSFRETEGRLVCHVKLKVEGSIEGAVFMGEKLFDDNKLSEYQAAFAEKINDEIVEIFHTFQDLGVDGLGLQEILRKRHWPIYQRHADNWHTSFAETTLVTEVDVIIRNTGAVK